MSINPPPYDPFERRPQGYTPDQPPVSTVTAADLPAFSFGNAFGVGFSSFMTQYPMLLAVTGIFIGVNAVNWVVQQILSLIPLLGLVASIAISLLLLGPLTAGGMFAGVRAARGQKIMLEDFGLGFQRYGTVVLVTLLLWLLTIAACVPLLIGVVIGAVVGNTRGGGPLPTAFIIIGGLITLVLVAMLSVRLYFAQTLAIDPALPERSATDCLREAWRITGESSLELFALILVTSIMSAASFLLVCVGGIFLGMPLSMAVYGAAYAMMSRRLFTGVCGNCAYDMNAIRTTVCPECGFDNSHAWRAQTQYKPML